MDEVGLGEVHRGLADRRRATRSVPAGVPAMRKSPGSGSSEGSCTTPGEIAFTRTPDGPNSAAQARVSVSSAPFVAL